MNNKTKITKTNFLTWLRSQPATRKFNYRDNEGCLFASFLSEGGKLKEVSCGGVSYFHSGSPESVQFCPWMQLISSRVARELARELKVTFTVSAVRNILKKS